MLVCPQPTIRDLKKAQNKLSVYRFNHPSTAIRKRPLHPSISFTIHPQQFLKRLLHPFISFTIHPQQFLNGYYIHPSHSPSIHLRYKRTIIFFIFLRFHPSTVISKTAITSVHLTHHPSTHSNS